MGTMSPGSGARAVESQEVGPGLFQVEAHGQGIDDLEALHIGSEFRRATAFIPVEAELYVFGRTGSPLWKRSPCRSLNS